MTTSASNRLAMWLVVLPLVLFAATITLFTGLMFFTTLNKAELDLVARITSWSCGGLLTWLVIGFIVFRTSNPEH